MFYEKLELNFDIPKLIEELNNSIFPLGEPLFQGKEYGYVSAFGGWSLQSYTGHWKDGWEVGHVANDEAKHIFFPDGKPNYKVFKFLNYAQPLEHKIPTEACVGEFKKVIDKIESMGLYPRRARITVLNPGTESTWHRDGVESQYLVRLHIPLITHEKCVHTCDDIKLHMPADGSGYIMWVNKFHKAENYSNIKRYHILMDVYDTKGITKYCKYDADINELQKRADNFRKNINDVILSDDDIKMFEEIKKQFTKK